MNGRCLADILPSGNIKEADGYTNQESAGRGAGRPKETRASVESNNDLIHDFRHCAVSNDDEVGVGR